MDDTLTACSKCKYADNWGQYWCTKFRKPDWFDCISGTYRRGNFKLCKDVNLGHCEHFEPVTKWWKKRIGT